MKNDHQLELNFDDPVEYLAPPTFLGGVTHRAADKQLGSSIDHVEIRVIVEYLPANFDAGRRGK